jgi:hypothetical protein
MHTAYPYVYICTHTITKQYYIGYRSANTEPSYLDLPKYRTSSATVRPDFENYDWQIIAEFFDGDSAYDFEQELISQHWNNPLLLNEHHRHKCNGRFKTKPGRVVSESTKEKIRQKNLGKKQSQETIAKKVRAIKGKPTWNRGIKSGPMSEENKQKISLANKGKPKSQEHKDKQSAVMKGREPWNKGVTGSQTAWNKGIPNPNYAGENNPAKREDVRAKISSAKKEYWARKKAQALHLG